MTNEVKFTVLTVDYPIKCEKIVIGESVDIAVIPSVNKVRLIERRLPKENISLDFFVTTFAEAKAWLDRKYDTNWRLPTFAYTDDGTTLSRTVGLRSVVMDHVFGQTQWRIAMQLVIQYNV